MLPPGIMDFWAMRYLTMASAVVSRIVSVVSPDAAPGSSGQLRELSRSTVSHFSDFHERSIASCTLT